MTEIYAVTAGLLFGLSLYGVLSRPSLIQRLLAANIMASSVFLYLVVLAVGQGARDPVPQAMVLTGIVIAVSITAFGLGLLRWLRAEEEAGERPGEGGRDRATTAHD